MKRIHFINRGQRLSPSARKIIKLRQRAFQSGGASLELQVPTNYIREISRDLNYDITLDASLIMTPNTIGESRLFNCKPEYNNNLYKWSENIENSYWAKESMNYTLNATTDPFGTNNAVKLTTATANSVNRLYVASFTPVAANLTITVSFYVRKAENNFIHVRFQTNTTAFGFCVNLTTAAITQGRYDGANLATFPTSYSATLLPDGWVYVKYTVTNGTSATTPYIYKSPSATTTANTVIGDGIYVFGQQYELGTVATTYQRTTDTNIFDFQATRATTTTVIQKDGSIGDSCYNLFTNSTTLTTQSVTLSNTAYNLSFTGTGTITLTGGISTSLVGTSATDRVSLSFTPTAGNTTFTVSGSVTNAQLSQGSTLKDYLKTTNRLNIPSIDYSLGSDKPALLVEPQSTNLVQRSEELDNAYWGKSASSISGNSILSPSNTMTGDKLIEDSTNAQHYFIRSSFSITNGLFYTYSIYAKVGERSKFRMRLSDGSSFSTQVDFDLITFSSTVTIAGWDNITASNIDAGNGWRRLIITAKAKSTVSTAFLQNWLLDNSGNVTYLGNGTSGLYVWGIQFEQSTFATSYIPTTTAAVTRNAYTSFVDMFNNSLFNKDNFTLFIEGYIDFRHSLNPWIGFSDSSTLFTGNSLYLYNGNAVGYYVGGARTDIALTTSDQVYFKTVIVKNGTTLKIFTDGVLKATDTLAIFDYRYLILSDGSARSFVQKLSLWKRTLSDADCILLTS